MTDEPQPQLDDDLLAFAARVFDLARHGDAGELTAMLDRGLPKDMRNDKGDTLVMLAAYNGNAPAVRALLEAGADPNIANDNGQTPLAGVCFKGEAAIAALLLDHGAAVEGNGDRTPLMVAAMFGKLDLVEMLLKHGADPDHRDGGGLGVLDLARSMGASGVEQIIERARSSRSEAPASRRSS